MHTHILASQKTVKEEHNFCIILRKLNKITFFRYRNIRVILRRKQLLLFLARPYEVL